MLTLSLSGHDKGERVQGQRWSGQVHCQPQGRSTVFFPWIPSQHTSQPIPLDLLSLVNYTDPPTQRGTGLLRNLRAGGGNEGPGPSGHTPTPESASDARAVYPLTLHHNGRMGGTHILYAESEKIRTEWKEKLEHAIAIRKAVQESNKAFEVEILSAETFLVPLVANATQGPMWEQNNAFTGRVTCSVPFSSCILWPFRGFC
jgi:RHO1 GDP-GTP exchange protein 1/2